MDTHTPTNWNELIGRQVQIHKDGTLVRTGYVEDVTFAADALWLEGHGTDLRTLYAKADGYSAVAVPAEAGC